MCGFDDLAYRITSQGQDQRKLGRWSYFSTCGKNNLKTTYITCYCPVKSNNPGSAYSQQLTYMANHKANIDSSITCPRQLFGNDLSEMLDSLVNQGQQIILSGDFNSEYADLCSYMLQYGLTDLIAEKHGDCPKTYNRSKNAPIDIIFGSSHLQAKKCGYLSFGMLAGDHRGIWIDIPKYQLFGYNPPQPTHASYRRLKLRDPRVVKRYITYLYDACMSDGLFSRMNHLHVTRNNPITAEYITEYESLDATICKIMQIAEKM